MDGLLLRKTEPEQSQRSSRRCCMPLFAGLFLVIVCLVACGGLMPIVLFRTTGTDITNLAFTSFGTTQGIAFLLPYFGKWGAEIYQMLNVQFLTVVQTRNREALSRCCKEPICTNDAAFGWGDAECGLYDASSPNDTAWWYRAPFCGRWDQDMQERMFAGSFGSKHGERRFLYFNIPRGSRQSQANSSGAALNESTNLNANAGWSWTGMDAYSPRGDTRYMSDNSFSPVALRTWTASRRTYGPGLSPRQSATPPDQLDAAEAAFLARVDDLEDELEDDLDHQLSGDTAFFDTLQPPADPYLDLQSDVFKLSPDGRVSAKYGGFSLSPTRWVLANYSDVLGYVGDAVCNASANGSSSFAYRDWKQHNAGSISRPFGDINRCRVTAAMTAELGRLTTANSMLNATTGLRLAQLHSPGFLFGALRSISRMDEAAVHAGHALAPYEPTRTANCSCHATKRLHLIDASLPSLTPTATTTVRRSALVELATPPSVLLHSFLKYETEIALFGPELDPYGRLSFAFALRIRNNSLPAPANYNASGEVDSVVILIFPLKNVINHSMSMVTTWASRMETYIFVFDWNDALLMTTHPLVPVEVPYPGDGVPHLFHCVNNSYRPEEFRSKYYDPTVHNNHHWTPRRKVVRCRHSKASLSATLPHFAGMVAESLRRSTPQSPLVHFKWEQDGASMFVAYNELLFPRSPTKVDKAWGLIFAPTRSLLGAFDDSRRFVVVLVVIISVSAACVASLLIYLFLVLPLATSLEDMRAALVLRPRGVSTSMFEVRREQRGTGCRSYLLPREIRALDAANEVLQRMLETIATCLPPAVISRLYHDDDSSDSNDGFMPIDGIDEHEDDTRHRRETAEAGIVAHTGHANEPAADDARSSGADAALMFFVPEPPERSDGETATLDAVSLPRRNSMNLSVSFADGSSHISSNDRPLRRSRPSHANPLGPQQQRCDAELSAGNSSSAVVFVGETHAQDAAPAASSSNPNLSSHVPSILLPSGLSGRASRAKCVFLSISLAHVDLAVDEYRLLVESVVKMAWHHGGDVDLLERNRVAISFGCFRTVEHLQDAAIHCALDIQQWFSECALALPQRAAGYGHLGIVIDAGRFEAFDFVVTLGDEALSSATTLRRRIVYSAAATAAKRLHSLCDEIKEPVIVTYDAARGSGQPAILIDNVRFFDGVDLARLARRGTLPLLTVVSLWQLMGDGTDPAQDGMQMMHDVSWAAKDALNFMLRGMYGPAALQWASLMQSSRWVTAQRLHAFCVATQASRRGYAREETSLSLFS